ncbi:PH domain-containing protein [Archaeoglobus neptunius]|uniref:PH domain-containing protein n=1 Tax=Archaeoglobus neptunius TaxID=2798580 RepID=UPI00192609EC|nr:PH domain-containing protein [Archaeoglobus neptunius]
MRARFKGKHSGTHSNIDRDRVTQNIPPERVIWRKRVTSRYLWTTVIVFGALMIPPLSLRSHTFIVPALAGISIALITAVLVYYGSTEYGITNYRVYARYGIFSRKIYEGYLDKIAGVEVRQSFLDRLVGVGDVIITLHGSDSRIEFRSVDSPNEVKDIINDAVYKNRTLWAKEV